MPVALLAASSVKALKPQTKCLAAGLNVCDRASHQNDAVAVAAFDTDGVSILPADSARERITCGELDFNRLLVANEVLNLTNAREASVECWRCHRNTQNKGLS